MVRAFPNSQSCRNVETNPQARVIINSKNINRKNQSNRLIISIRLIIRGNVRLKNLVEMLVTLSLIDHLLEQAKEEKSISRKKLEVAISQLVEIKNMTRAWKEGHENKEKKN